MDEGLRKLVFSGYKGLLMARNQSEAFNPFGGQTIHQLHAAVVAIEREGTNETVLCVHNLSTAPVTIPLPGALVGRELESLFGEVRKAIEGQKVNLEPYQYIWFRVGKK